MGMKQGRSREMEAEPMTAHQILWKGGEWLGSLRTRVQTMFICGNGEDITWGSSEKLQPEPTMAQIEELGAHAVAGYHRQAVEPLLERLRYIIIEARNNPGMTLECYLQSAAGKAVSRAMAYAMGLQPPLQFEDNKTKFLLSAGEEEVIG